MPKNIYPKTITFFGHEVHTKISLKEEFKLERKAMRALAPNDPRQQYLSPSIQKQCAIELCEDGYFGNLCEGEYNFIVTCENQPKLICDLEKNHSHLANGKKVLAAGTLVFREGKLVEMTNNSGHYRPTDEEMLAIIQALYDASGEALEYFISYCDEIPKLYSVPTLMECDSFIDAIPLTARKPLTPIAPAQGYDQRLNENVSTSDSELDTVTTSSEEEQPVPEEYSEKRHGRALHKDLIKQYKMILEAINIERAEEDKPDSQCTSPCSLG